MSKVYTDPTNYTNIAAAIRTKLDNEETYKPSEMPAAILAIETGGEIEPITITQNGIYTAPASIDGYSPITVSVSAGSAHIGFHCPRICVGDKLLAVHSDCELDSAISASDYEASANISAVERVDNMNLRITLDSANLVSGANVTLKGKSSLFRYMNGDSDVKTVTIETLHLRDVYETFGEEPDGNRDIVSRMAVIRYNSKNDDGTDTVSFTGSFRDVGLGSANLTSFGLSGNSFLSSGNITVNINQRDAASYYIWKEEGDADNVHYLKMRWKGASAYSGAIDQEWEIILLSNGDFIVRAISIGTNAGNTNFNGTAFTPSLESPVCFYRKDYFGFTWDILTEHYTFSHHHPEADSIFVSGTFATKAAVVDSGYAYINNVAYDDNAFTFNFQAGFTWHGKTYATVSGNSWMGIGTGSEDIKVHRRDAKMYYLYGCHWNLTDLNMRAVQLSWRGASQYNAAIDRWWSLWLFENGDAMIRISTVGSNTGECSFYGQSFNAVGTGYISFYYNSSASNYDIRYEKYTLEHHIG